MVARNWGRQVLDIEMAFRVQFMWFRGFDSELNFVLGCNAQVKGVAPINWNHHRIDFMKPIVSLCHELKEKVELGGWMRCQGFLVLPIHPVCDRLAE